MGAVGIEETLLVDLVRALPLSRLVNAKDKSALDLHCNDTEPAISRLKALSRCDLSSAPSPSAAWLTQVPSRS